MMEVSRILLVAAGMAVLAFVLCGCATKVRYVHSEEPYSKLIGARYRLLADCWVVESQWKTGELTSVLDELGLRFRGLPPKVDEDLIGTRTSSAARYNIIGVLRAGSIIRVVAVREITKPVVGTWVVVEVVAEGTPAGEHRRFDARWLATGPIAPTPEHPVPRFLKQYVEPLGKTSAEYLQ